MIQIEFTARDKGLCVVWIADSSLDRMRRKHKDLKVRTMPGTSINAI